jgi:lecithin-cholesterol acyltransferase
MLHLLSLLSIATPPVVMVPSHFGSRLHINTTRQKFWYCPSSLHDQHVWIRLRDIIRPFANCLLDYLTVDLDNQTGELSSRPDVNLSTIDFGGVAGIRGIGPEYFGHFLPVNYEAYIQSFLESGYSIRQQLFSAPYDWRFGLAQPDSYFRNLQQLIEHAYSLNSNTKVAILAHGMGGTLTHMFLTKKMTKQWRQTYIHSSTYVAPSWTGSGQSLFAMWRLRFPYLHFRFQTLRDFVASMGAFHAQLPNAIAYGNSTVLVDPNGRNLTGPDVFEFLKQHGKLTEREIRIAQKNVVFASQLPETPDFDVNILYNSGVLTPMGMRLNSWTDIGAPIYGKGDSLVGSKVIEWACENWRKADIRLRCRDLMSDEKKYRHRYILKTPEMANLIRAWIVEGAKTPRTDFNDEL